MTPTRVAEQVPATAAVEAQDVIDTRFLRLAEEVTVVIEARDGNLLEAAPLAELHSAVEAVRVEQALRSLLLPVAVPGVAEEQLGVVSITDAVDARLERSGFEGGIYSAPPESVQQATAAIIDTTGPELWGLADQASLVDGVWVSPALFLTFAAEGAAIGTDDIGHERFARDVLSVLRSSSDTFDAWTVAEDPELSALDQADGTAPYLVVTAAVILLVVGSAYRSYWPVAIVGLAFGTLLIWIEGGVGLTGLTIDPHLSTILPVALLSVGGHVALEGLTGRRSAGPSGNSRPTMPGAVGAATLAVAFLAIAVSPLESLRRFGLAAAIATAAVFLLLGVAAPVLSRVVEDRSGRNTLTSAPRRDLLPALAAGTGATAMILAIVTSPALGAASLGVYALGAVVVPTARRRARESVFDRDPRSEGGAPNGRRRVNLPIVRPWIAITAMVILAVTGVAVALDLTPAVGSARWFDPRSDFLTGIAKAEEYGGTIEDERVSVLIEGPLHEPVALEAVAAMIGAAGRADQDGLQRNRDGTVVVDAPLLRLAEDAGSARLADHYRAALRSGTMQLSAAETSEFLSADGSTGRFSTVVSFALADPAEDERAEAVRSDLEPLVADLDSFLQELDPEATAVLTGPSVIRSDQADAITDSVLLTFVVATLGCLTIVAALTRSLRCAAVVAAAAAVVAVWSLGSMAALRRPLEAPTAIGAAVAIGFSAAHATQLAVRYLHERRSHDPAGALQATGDGAVGPMAASAIASSAGFAVLAIVPVPMLSSFGLLSAVAVLLSVLVAALIVPSILPTVSGRGLRSTEQHPQDEPPGAVHTGPPRARRPRITVEIGPEGGWVEAIAEVDGAVHRRRGAATQDGIVEAMVAAITAGSPDPPPFPITISRTAGLLVLVLEHPGGTITAGVAPLDGPMTHVLETAVLSALGWRTATAQRRQ